MQNRGRFSLCIFLTNAKPGTVLDFILRAIYGDPVRLFKNKQKQAGIEVNLLAFFMLHRMV